jgi:hypothetical protein
MNRYYMFQLKLAIVKSIPHISDSRYTEYNTFKHPVHHSLNKAEAILRSSCETRIWFYPSIYSSVLQLVLFLHVFQTKPSMGFSCLNLSHSLCLVHTNKISQRIRMMKIFIALLTTLTWYVLTLRSSYLLQHPVLKHPQPIQFSACFCHLQLFICNILLYNAAHV